MKICGLQKTTLIDFPGRVAATIFLGNCNFRCPWCYSSELVLPEIMAKQPEIQEKTFFDFLKKRKGLLQGLVICGGEPTLNKELPIFIKKIKKMRYAVKLDTNGSNPKMLKRLIDKKLIDYVAMDLKAPLSPRIQNSKPEIPSLSYGKAAGAKVNMENIKKSIKLIKDSGIDYEFRTTVVPGLHTKEDIIQIARDISPAKKYFLQNFRPEKTVNQNFEKIKPYPKEFLLEIQKIIAPFFETCQVR
jgi:pyruvate formate lyase activating enzyme